MINILRTFIFSISLLASSLTIPAAWTAQPLAQPGSSVIVSSSWQEVVEFAKGHLSLQGHLVTKSDGFVYLKVDDEYIHTLLPMLGVMEKGYKKPPYFRSSEATGAHISVFYEEENILPDEIGQIFHFTPNQIVIVKASPKAHFIVMQVSSPELEALRKKYGLKPKLFGHEYHISLGKKTVKPKHH